MTSFLDTWLKGGAVALLGLATACVSTGEINDPVVRKATWFSFISGEDIALRCQDDGLDEYRMVYVADRREQVRIYDLTVPPDAAPSLRSRVMPVNVTDWLSVQNETGLSNPLSPTDVLTQLPMEATLPILTGLNKGGWSMRPAPVGQKIASHSTFWLASGCEAGKFYFQAWDYPDPEFLGLDFPALVFALDTTTLRPRAHPTDGKRRTFDRSRPRPGYSVQEDRRELYNMIVTETGVAPGS